MTGGGPAGDTIVALSSGRLPAAIAVIRSSGPGALAAAEALAGPLGPTRRASLRALRDPASGDLIDRALVLTFAAPDTATGEDIVEYQCHGSRAVVGALISALVAFPGVRAAEPGEFTRRALLNGRIDLTQAEGLAELLEAETEAQRRSALRRSQGELRDRIEQIRAELVTASAEAEVAIDYADEEDGSGASVSTERLNSICASIEALLSAPRVEKMRDGARVVVAGPPNAGKSSLVNALAGEERAIVTAIPGTTRDRIEVPLAIGGAALVLVDTAGLRATSDEVEAIGVGLTERELATADLVLWLGEESERPAGAHVVQIAAKSDLVPHSSGIAVSAKTGEGISGLKRWLSEQADAICPISSQLSVNQREADLLGQCCDATERAARLREPVLIAEELRHARLALDQVSGRAGVEDVLDALFGRFCLGK